MFTIRAFQTNDAEYKALVAVENACWPDYPMIIEEKKHRDDSRDPKVLFQRFVVTVDAKIVASCIYCEPWWAMKPRKYYMDISVHPDCRRRGIGTACYNWLMEKLAEFDPALIEATTRDDQSDALHFLKERGFKKMMRFPTSLLDVESFDPAPFLPLAARVEKTGIRILPLTELREIDPDWQRKYWDLDWELMQDIPTTDPVTRQTFENFVERTFNSPAFNAASQFVALDEGQWVGMSGLWLAPANPEMLFTGLTGVIRSYRRKGIATAMKLRGLAYAKAYGVKNIETDNEENNPMYQVNMRLGFKPQPAWLELHKEIQAAREKSHR